MTRRFVVAILGFMALAFALRLWYASASPIVGTGGDPAWYHGVANRLADGLGFTSPPRTGARVGAPTAFHPPLFPLLLAAGSELGLDSFRQHQAIGCLLGALTVGGIGLIARRLAGEVAGATAAGMAAIYLPLIGDSSTLFSEALYGLTIVGVLLAALRVLERPTVAHAALLGVAVALAALTRGEGLALILLALPLCRRGGPGTGARVAATLGACAIVVAPWAIHSSAAMDRPVLLSTNVGSALAGANCRSTYGSGPLQGSWDLGCLLASGQRRALSPNEAVQSERWRREAVDYARDHAGRVAVVVVVRELRTWSLWKPRDSIRLDAFVFGQPLRWGWWTLASTWVVLALAGYGAVLLWRRSRAELAVLAAPIVLVVAFTAVTYGASRFRAAAEIPLVVLAALAAVELVRRIGRRRAWA
ncbi:ArnT family glycosyltransferase [Capillimicrobium parvum]|uniref:Glycosyltransferase RgtA/B/C/D-like domain-containing protein n=1 Tax=Capillimicrobium parvum TaxID=2884022 RepID=A0A9E7C2E9_9ACTN|nr:glycosyltransferase family 39 protein [Capillimicrobium parvum]UGS37378.1 hypothetical protein DSM104329_03793 [Capillimicrobium parvum]